MCDWWGMAGRVVSLYQWKGLCSNQHHARGWEMRKRHCLSLLPHFLHALRFPGEFNCLIMFCLKKDLFIFELTTRLLSSEFVFKLVKNFFMISFLCRSSTCSWQSSWTTSITWPGIGPFLDLITWTSSNWPGLNMTPKLSKWRSREYLIAFYHLIVSHNRINKPSYWLLVQLDIFSHC